MEEFKPRPGDEVKKPETEQEQEGKAVILQQSFWQRTKNAFFSGYVPNENFLEEFWFNNAIPVMKDSFVNFGNKILNYLFYGGAVSGNTSGGVKPSYGRYYGKSQTVSTSFVQPKMYDNAGPDYKAVTFCDYGQARVAKDRLDDTLAQYHRVSVGDYIDIANEIARNNGERLVYINSRGNEVGLTPEHIDYEHGWIDLRNVRIIPAGGGRYTLELPSPAPLDN